MMSSLLRFDHVKLIFNYEMRNNKHKQQFFFVGNLSREIALCANYAFVSKLNTLCY